MKNDIDETSGLDKATVDRNPLKQFQLWFDYAISAGVPLPEAMTMATVDAACKPHARVLLLKQVDEIGFVFFTNYRSAKAEQIESNANVTLCFHWAPLERQVRVEGKVEKITRAESEAYFQTRPRESQIGAWASPQSQVIEDRAALESRIKEIEDRFRDRQVDCPEYWGGYRLIPDLIEFWKGRVGRLHDRLLFERDRNGEWEIRRLAP